MASERPMVGRTLDGIGSALFTMIAVAHPTEIGPSSTIARMARAAPGRASHDRRVCAVLSVGSLATRPRMTEGIGVYRTCLDQTAGDSTISGISRGVRVWYFA